MGKYLRTMILEPTTVKDGRSSMRVQVLKKGDISIYRGVRLHFELPLEVHLITSDRIDFYHGSYRSFSLESEPAIEGVITHEDYVSARIYRGHEGLFNINSGDMQLLEWVRRKEETLRGNHEEDSLLDRVSKSL